MNLLVQPTRFLFFTGKGGVGKTSTACATALGLTQQGKRVLLISTDPASNLDQVLKVRLSSQPTLIPEVPGLFALNVNPEAAAREYRERVIGPYRGVLPAESIAGMEEQLSGACTVEVAAFDEFTSFLVDEATQKNFDHVIFDTAPTGHTLRLLQLPAAWSGFLSTNERGASCLGPTSGLKTQREKYTATVNTLADPAQTTLVLVTRPDRSAIKEAERTSLELESLGLRNQFLIVNGVFRATDPADAVASALEMRGARALAEMPARLQRLPRMDVRLRGFNIVGIEALQNLFDDDASQIRIPNAGSAESASQDLPRLSTLIDEIAREGHGLVMIMGKGGVGKTTIAAAIATELAARGLPVHLTTTDPAAHLALAVGADAANLKMSRIDPEAETEAYRKRVIERTGKNLDAEGLALLEEDLRSPCTEEVAVFHAFSHLVSAARREIVVMDTAPTGHTLLLLDATGAYHREVLRNSGAMSKRMVTPMMRLKDQDFTKVLLVTLPETTPVLEAAQLQADLRRAEIEPYAWIINNTLAGTETTDPLLQERARAELAMIREVKEKHAGRVVIAPWMIEEPTGAGRLHQLAGGRESAVPVGR